MPYDEITYPKRSHDMDELRCWNCRHYEPEYEDQDQSGGCAQGTCHRHAPTAQEPDENERVVNYGYWPVVLSGDFCGDFASKT